MLQLLLGPEHSGKFHVMLEQMADLSEQSTKKIMVLVPEQFSFRTERECNRRLPPHLRKNVQVLSFRRLSHAIFKQLGGLAGTYADNIAKTVMMHLAMREVQDGLQIYQNSIGKDGFSGLMLQTVDEFKNSAITPEQFELVSSQIPDGKLKQKMQDVSLLYTTYTAMLGNSYRDPSDDLTQATERAKGSRFFENTHVFLYGFVSFSQQQFHMLSLMLEQGDVTIALNGEKEDSSLFHTIRQTASSLKRMATKLGVSIKKPIYLTSRMENQELLFLQRHILRPQVEEYPQTSSRIKVLLASNEYSEIDEILSEIWKLVQEGYHFRDIALVTHDMEHYRNILESSLKKYQIPYFMDETVSVQDYAFMQCAIFLLQAAAASDLHSMVGILKSGYTKFDVTQVSIFENYLYTWNITASQLKNKFVQNPRGFVDEAHQLPSDQEDLQIAETIRFQLVKAVELVKQAGMTAAEIGSALMEAMDLLEIPETISQKINSYYEQEKIPQAEEQQRIWDIFVNLLELLAVAAGEYPLDLRLYTALFQTAMQEYDMGQIPQSMDSVLIGSADRMILDDPKIVFVFGANDGNFPYYPQFDGIFTDMDRIELEEMGISLSRPLRDRVLEERFYAYSILCSPTEKLYLTARLSDVGGEACYPSELIGQLQEMFGENVVTYSDQLDYFHLCVTHSAAFYQLAFHYHDTDPYTVALKSYFLQQKEMQPFMHQLQAAAHQKKFRIEKQENVEKLFGKDMRISPTQAENFYKCRFLFFCANGMKAYPRKKADLDPLSLGTVVHHVMEALLKRPGFEGCTSKQLEQWIHEILEEFFISFMGGDINKTARFKTLYRNLEQSLLQLALRVQQEFLVSDFRPVSFEMPIQEDGEVKPVCIPLSNHGSVKIIGEIDRVDAYQKDGKTYLRVVDYKSGSGKVFRISDLYYGLSMQMLLYLFSLWENGQEKFNHPVPAGVLYMPADGSMGKFTLFQRSQGNEDMKQSVEEGFRMNGLLLQDSRIIQAMEKVEPGSSGKYLPVTMQETEDLPPEDEGNFSKKSLEFLVTMDEMAEVKDFVRSEILSLCERLLDGDIQPVPLKGYGEQKNGYACTYCAYQSVCGHQDNDPCNEVKTTKKKEFLEQIREEGEHE